MTSPSKERGFDLKELFFSTTDKHGKITCGNEVFTRISGYEPGEIIGRPHSIIRHPDMPRVVFRLLWDRITEGKSISAYVKNRAKNGQYYWVLALVSPIENGYLSVRFKPSTEILKLVDSLYHTLRQEELKIESEPGNTKDDAIAKSQTMLIEALNKHGFADYDAFIEAAFVREFCSRQVLLERESKATGIQMYDLTDGTSLLLKKIAGDLSSILSQYEDFFKMESSVLEVTSFVSSLSLAVQLASINLTIKSEHTGIEAGPLTVIASWLQEGSVKIASELEKLVVPISENLRRIKSGLFNVAASQLQVEMIRYFLQETKRLDEHQRGYSDVEGKRLMELLSLSAQETFVSSQDKLQQLGSAIRNVNNSFVDLQREVLGLSLAHVNGRVECAKMPDALSLESILQEAMVGINQAKNQVMALNTLFSSLDQLMQGFGRVITSLGSNYKSLVSLTQQDR